METTSSRPAAMRSSRRPFARSASERWSISDWRGSTISVRVIWTHATPLLNDFVGGREHVGWDGDAQRLGRAQVDHELEARPLHRQRSRRRALEDLVDEHAGAAIEPGEARAIGHEAVGVHELAPAEEHGYLLEQAHAGDAVARPIGKGIRDHDERVRTREADGDHGHVETTRLAHVERLEGEAEPARRCLRVREGGDGAV